jgi:hypothetical protein
MRLLQKIARFCDHEKGLEIFPDEICHKIVPNPAIWQLSGDYPYRFPLFHIPNNGVVITHVFAKRGGKRQTTRDNEKKKAVRLLREFEAAHLQRNLVWEQEEPQLTEETKEDK